MHLGDWLSFNFSYFYCPPWDTGISPPELLDFIGHHPSGRVIDLGCGTGTNLITLAEHGWQVTGIDFAVRAIQIAKQKANKKEVDATLMVGDVTDLDKISGPFDLALDIGCFHALQDPTAYLDGLARILTSGGHWLLYGFIQSVQYPTSPGLGKSVLALIQSNKLEIQWRKDGVDRRSRPSAWFLFKKL